MSLAEILSYGFIQRALVAGILIAVLCSTLGVFLVLRRLSLIGDGLSHVTFGSVALSLLAHVSPLYVSLAAIPLVMLSSVGILKLTEKARVYGDAAIGIVSSAGIALGITLASVSGGFNVDLFSYLFGNILSVSGTEVAIAALLFVALGVSIALFYADLFAVTFNEDLARISGIKTGRINIVLVLMTALVVVLAMKVVGIMLVSALLILPAVSALQLAGGFKGALLLSAIFGTLSVVAGIFVSFFLNLPAGGTIVMASLLLFALSFLGRRLLRS